MENIHYIISESVSQQPLIGKKKWNGIGKNEEV